MYKYHCEIEATIDGIIYETLTDITILSVEQITPGEIKLCVINNHVPLKYTSWKNFTYQMVVENGYDKI